MPEPLSLQLCMREILRNDRHRWTYLVSSRRIHVPHWSAFWIPCLRRVMVPTIYVCDLVEYYSVGLDRCRRVSRADMGVSEAPPTQSRKREKMRTCRHSHAYLIDGHRIHLPLWTACLHEVMAWTRCVYTVCLSQNRNCYTVFRHDLFELYSLNQARVLVVVFLFGCGRFLTKGLLEILDFIFDRLHRLCISQCC